MSAERPFSSSSAARRNCRAAFPTPRVTDRRPVRADAVTAGTLVIAGMLLGAGAGFALGSVFGLGVPLGLLGLFAGLFGGFAAVYARYKRL